MSSTKQDDRSTPQQSNLPRYEKMIEIDGSQGEGGGQIIRTSLALAAVTGQPIKLVNIRAGRKKSGLLRQHLTCVRAAERICNANVDGAELGASTLTFEPQAITGGHFAFQVGTAGSTSLVAQTVIPALMSADEPSVLELEGGTHNPWAPPFEFLVRVFGEQLNKCGPVLDGEIVRHGFFPAGGGKVIYKIEPEKNLRGIQLLDLQGKLRPKVTALVSDLPKSVADRECDTIRRKANWHRDCFDSKVVPHPRGPGNAVLIELGHDNVTEIFTGFGKQGVKAEQIARGVLREARSYLAAEVPVGEYLADQLLLPLGLAASRGQSSKFRTVPLSMHSKTHIEVLRSFLDIEITTHEEQFGQTLVHVQ